MEFSLGAAGVAVPVVLALISWLMRFRRIAVTVSWRSRNAAVLTNESARRIRITCVPNTSEFLLLEFDRALLLVLAEEVIVFHFPFYREGVINVDDDSVVVDLLMEISSVLQSIDDRLKRIERKL